MCNFHSIIGRMLRDTAELYHDTTNSHSGMISTAKWRENKPNEIVRVFEAEWDGKGAFPSDSALIRNHADCPEKLKDKIRNHYKKLQSFLKGEVKSCSYFMDGEKYGDVWSSLTTLPDNVKFPDTLNGYLDLRSLTTLPDNVKFPDTLNGYLDLSSLTTLPDNVKFPDTLNGYLYLSSLTTLPDNVKFPDTLNGYLDLRSDLRRQYDARQKKK